MLELLKSQTKKSNYSVWEYDNEKHMNEVRAYLSKNNNIPNSWLQRSCLPRRSSSFKQNINRLKIFVNKYNQIYLI